MAHRDATSGFGAVNTGDLTPSCTRPSRGFRTAAFTPFGGDRSRTCPRTRARSPGITYGRWSGVVGPLSRAERFLPRERRIDASPGETSQRCGTPSRMPKSDGGFTGDPPRRLAPIGDRQFPGGLCTALVGVFGFRAPGSCRRRGAEAFALWHRPRGATVAQARAGPHDGD